MLDSLTLMSKNKNKNNGRKKLVIFSSKSRKIFLITFNILSHKLYARDLVWSLARKSKSQEMKYRQWCSIFENYNWQLRNLRSTAEFSRDEKRELGAILDGNLPGRSTHLAIWSICTVCTAVAAKIRFIAINTYAITDISVICADELSTTQRALANRYARRINSRARW